MTRMTPDHYARELLNTLGFENTAIAATDSRSASLLWAESGAQFLTGTPEGSPLPCPAPLATCAQGAWLALASLSGGALDPHFPAHRLLGERAALLALHRHGAISPGGACRLLDCADGQLALNLPRADDWQLLAAWLEQPVDNWHDIAQALRQRSGAALVERGRLLGLAVATSRPPAAGAQWHRATQLRVAAAQVAAAQADASRRTPPLVIDLSSLWAGPLCTQLLGEMGARVIKVESLSRPDGARLGPPAFFDLLNGYKQSVVLDLAADSGRRQLRALLARADIVVESARPRGLEQMGIHAADIVRAGDGRVWVSITGYGRDAPMRDWIAYGDDAGVAAGLSWLLRSQHGCNVFCGDAIADPLTGLHAALLAWATWVRGGGALLDVSLCGVAAHCIASGPADAAPAEAFPVAPPRARSIATHAPALGSSTAAVLREFGIGE
jgi:hypothetical protein